MRLIAVDRSAMEDELLVFNLWGRKLEIFRCTDHSSARDLLPFLLAEKPTFRFQVVKFMTWK